MDKDGDVVVVYVGFHDEDEFDSFAKYEFESREIILKIDENVKVGLYEATVYLSDGK